tara:strand:- start:17 stop:649 length:633 start_codon:yes stop_codon:yes gene_type:complete
LEHSLEIIDWGFICYKDALAKQIALVEKKIQNPDLSDYLIFAEHEPVYTIGSRAGANKNLIWDEAMIKKNKLSVIKTNRGGDITYHGPGQLVIYPIIHLKYRDLHAYLRNLETVIIQLLKSLGIESSIRQGKTGIWIENKKICALGVAVRSWITYHGLALNVNPNLSHFDGIIPCGITDGTVTSLEQELHRVTEKKWIKDRFIVEFKSIF